MTLGNYVSYYKIILRQYNQTNYQMYPNSHDICGIKSYMHFFFQRYSQMRIYPYKKKLLKCN